MNGPKEHATAEGPTLFVVVVLGLVGQLLTYLVTVVVARSVSVEAFEHYVAAVALFVLLVAVSPLGVEKLAIRVLPPLQQSNDWPGIRAYMRFAASRAGLGLGLALTLALLWAPLSAHAPLASADTSVLAILVAVGVLPLGIAAHIGFEVLTALGRGAGAAALFRLGVPGMALISLALLHWSGRPPGALLALLAWGSGLALAALGFALLFRKARPAVVHAPQAPPEARVVRRWAAMAWPLWAYRVAVAFMASAGVLALDLFGQPAQTVGAYAAASAIVGVMTVVVTSTNRLYGRDVAISLDRRGATATAAIVRRRLRWLVPVILVALVLVFGFAEEMLGFFGPEFVADGAWAVRILALAAALSMLLALTPTVLKYSDNHAAILSAVGLAVAVQIGLLALLVPGYGATGAALAAAAGVAVKHLRMAQCSRKPPVS